MHKLTEIQQLAATDKKKIAAIAMYRDCYYVGLKEAKDAVENLMLLPALPQYFNGNSGTPYSVPHHHLRDNAEVHVTDIRSLYPEFLTASYSSYSIDELVAHHIGRYHIASTTSLLTPNAIVDRLNDNKVIAQFSTSQDADEYLDYLNR